MIDQVRSSRLRKVVWAATLFVGLGLAVYFAYGSIISRIFPTITSDQALTYVVARREILDTVIERGTIESQNTVRGRCELPGWENKIIWIVPEGTHIKTGESVVKFDSAEIDRLISEKKTRLIEVEGKLEQAKQDLEVQKNKNESDVAAAELELTLADLDLKKYRDGDYNAEKAELERSITEGDAELKKVSEELNNMRALVRKGFRSPEQLRELELRVSSAGSRVDRDKQKLFVLIEFDYKRKITEFEAKAKEAQRKLDRAKTTADAELKKAEVQIMASTRDVTQAQNELKELDEHKKNCEILAPQDGTVAYANSEWYNPEDRIREGATVRRQQDVFYLPDMSKLQVKVNVHESVVNKIKKELRTRIRVDAFPESPFDGAVSFVAELATSSFSNTKNYEVVVLVDQLPPEMRIKPGMTAQVEIRVGVYTDVLAVPISAVTEHQGESYVYVQNPGSVERNTVTTGRMTHSFIEILSGLNEGEAVLLDAYQRGLKDFGSSDRSDTGDGDKPADNSEQAAPTSDQSDPDDGPIDDFDSSSSDSNNESSEDWDSSKSSQPADVPIG